MRIRVNLPDPPKTMDGVETDTHLHAIHAPSLLVAITVEREVFTGMVVRAANLRCGCSVVGSSRLICQMARGSWFCQGDNWHV